MLPTAFQAVTPSRFRPALLGPWVRIGNGGAQSVLGHAHRTHFLRSRYLILVATTSVLYCAPSPSPILLWCR